MISSEVQRTLVKSPPELWSEISDPAALARHLGELGEIRIVRVEPEKTVEWAAEHTTGTVSIQPSGWGTKVTLSVTRELVAPVAEAEAVSQAADAGPRAAEAGSQAAQVQAQVAEADPPAPDAEAAPDPSPIFDTSAQVEMEAVGIEPEPAGEQEPEQADAEPVELHVAAEPEPRRGFFARLFGRSRRKTMAEPEVKPGPTAEADSSLGLAVQAPRAFAAVSEVLAQEAVESQMFAIATGTGAASGGSTQADAPEPQAAETDIAAELMAAEEVAAEEVAAEEVTAVLAAVLDRLGAAHHRPFSRS